MTFDPNKHLIQLKSKQGSQDYLPVQFRLVWYREECPQGTVDTEEITVDLDRECQVEAFVWNNEKRRSEKVMKSAKGYARFKATVTDGKGGRATATKSECAANFPDYIEKAETGAVGRALAMLGYGTQFAPEMDEQHRIVDAPVDRSDDQDDRKPATNPQPQQQQRAQAPARPQPQQPAKPTEQRTALILDNGPLDDPMVEARKDVLNAIYNDGKRRGLWTSTNAMAVYMTTALKRPADQPVLPSHLPNLSNDEIALVKSAVEAVKPATAGAGGGR